MFEMLEEFQSLNMDGMVRQMVWEAMEYGRPAADHRTKWEIMKDLTEELSSAFQNGRPHVDRDWRFQNGRAYGFFCFHSDGRLHGMYHYI